MVARLRSFGLIVAASVIAASCGGGNLASTLVQAPKYDPDDQSKCGVSKSQERPLIVEWPSPDRLELENKVREGVVVVHYAGCEMSVLERCSIPAKYGYLGATRAHDELDINNADDLYANLPVGAAKLEDKLQRSGRLTVKMDLVGRYESQKPSVRLDELEGACLGATHFVYGVMVGAFDFSAGGKARIGASAGAVSVGLGARSEADRETITRDGDASACDKATPDDKAPPPQCGALIRLEVVPLSEALSTPSVVPSTASTAMAGIPPKVEPIPPPGGAMLPVPAGSFQMGSARGFGQIAEEPMHSVSVMGFEMDATEVTVADFDACEHAGVCLSADAAGQCNEGKAGRQRHPINCVTHDQAAGYCRWVGKRLPTEEEWEYAARGTDGRIYPWGNAAPSKQLCWKRSDGTCEVGSFPAGDSPFGLHDMAGNVAEWTASDWSESYDQPRAKGASVERGGAWAAPDPDFVRATARVRVADSSHGFSVGFRCAR